MNTLTQLSYDANGLKASPIPQTHIYKLKVRGKIIYYPESCVKISI
jgi:hypothetical protein